MGISTHILDTTLGRPAANVEVVLERRDPAGLWQHLASARTNADGRVPTLLDTPTLGTYRLVFAVEAYLRAQHGSTFYPEVPVHFVVENAAAHYHVPLLLNPFGYSTYRGS